MPLAPFNQWTWQDQMEPGSYDRYDPKGQGQNATILAYKDDVPVAAFCWRSPDTDIKFDVVMGKTATYEYGQHLVNWSLPTVTRVPHARAIQLIGLLLESELYDHAKIVPQPILGEWVKIPLGEVP